MINCFPKKLHLNKIAYTLLVSCNQNNTTAPIDQDKVNRIEKITLGKSGLIVTALRPSARASLKEEFNNK